MRLKWLLLVSIGCNSGSFAQNDLARRNQRISTRRQRVLARIEANQRAQDPSKHFIETDSVCTMCRKMVFAPCPINVKGKGDTTFQIAEKPQFGEEEEHEADTLDIGANRRRVLTLALGISQEVSAIQLGGEEREHLRRGKENESKKVRGHGEILHCFEVQWAFGLIMTRLRTGLLCRSCEKQSCSMRMHIHRQRLGSVPSGQRFWP